jgi:L-lactate dehydrogenase complex protein LldG
MNNVREIIVKKLRRGRREFSLTSNPYSAPEIKDRVQAFVHGLEKVFATYAIVTSNSELMEEIEKYLQQQSVAKEEVVVTGEVRKAGLLDNSSLKLVDAPTRGEESSAITFAYAGIAETGSLVLLSGADSPVTTNFLPDNFICVLREADLLNDMESLWLRMQSEQRAMPRAINIVTGPSRTADVEQTIQMGAHGPRRVHVIILSDNS